jgi:23S rRNA (cytosine1962-C5)-methyltransferase
MTLSVILKAKRAQPFYGRHPWVFAGAVEKVEGNPADGDEVILRASTGNFIAYGLYNSQSKILVRLYSWDESQPITPEFFRGRLQTAIRLRHDILQLNHGPLAAYRVCFSESDQLSGLIVDRYGEWLTVQLTALGLAKRRGPITEILNELLQPKGIYLRTEKGIGKLEGCEQYDELLTGEQPPSEYLIEENGLKFAVNLAEGQKTGYYLDQRDNRLAVAKFCKGKRVLDAFSYSSGFGIYAANAGAKSVLCLDASEAALNLGRRNSELNQLPQLSFRKGDVFHELTSLVQVQEQFDVIVLDPPKFARNRAAIPDAIEGYRRLHRMAMKLLSPDGILVSCCCTGLISMVDLEDLITQVAMDTKRSTQILERRGPSADHPVSVACREGGYLKCILSRVV